MNAPVLSTSFRASPSIERRLFTVRDIQLMQSAGVIAPGERVELWEGEIIPMSPKYDRHEVMRRDLTEALTLIAQKRVSVISEPSVFLSETSTLEPDIAVYPRGMRPQAVRGSDLLLAVEIGDTSFPTDLRDKSRVYAAYGVEHLWVIDVRDGRSIETHVHRGPGQNGYTSIEVFGVDRPIQLPFDPEQSVRLSELG
jgi:Uma2 family endonuclease